MQLCFFSDDHSDHFLPLTLTRPVHDLRVGILTIQEKWEYELGLKTTCALVPIYLSSVFKYNSISTSTDCIWINSRYLPTSELLSEILNLEPGAFIINNETPVAAKIDPKESLSWIESNSPNFDDLTPISTSFELTAINFLWDLVSQNALQIEEDIKRLQASLSQDHQLEKLLGYSNPSQIYIPDSAKIEPGCTLIADEGPIFIGENATLEAGSIIRGPSAICDKATVKMKARIY